MSVVHYRDWNWEFDFGVDELAEDQLNGRYAIGFFDHGGRVYRVEICGDGPSYNYEYYCDDRGRTLEKRSYDEHGRLCALVRICYDEASGFATETAWSPSHAGTEQVRIPLRKYPAYGSRSAQQP